MLDEKICLVTGSGGGIGRETAIEMARQGAGAVMVSDINDEGGREAVELVRAAGADAEYIHCDMGKAERSSALIEATVERFGVSTCCTTTRACTSPTSRPTWRSRTFRSRCSTG